MEVAVGRYTCWQLAQAGRMRCRVRNECMASQIGGIISDACLQDMPAGSTDEEEPLSIV